MVATFSVRPSIVRTACASSDGPQNCPRDPLAPGERVWLAPCFSPQGRRYPHETYVETQLAPTLSKGDIVILDNLPAHMSAKAEKAVRARGAWFCSCHLTVPI
jgi:hypothetical protein